MTLKRPQILALAVAAMLGLLAFGVMKSAMNKPVPSPVVVKQEGTQILVVREDTQLGQVMSEAKLRWQEWPTGSVAPTWITRETNPNAMTEFNGYFARTSLYTGEPLMREKLIKPGNGGMLAAVLRPGMRAVSTKISENTAAGKMILPGDYVDVFVSKRTKGGETVGLNLMRNVRILAIGQNIEVSNGKKTADGNVATLEVTVGQASRLSAATLAGEIWLALRSIADSGPSAKSEDRPDSDGTVVKFLKYGVPGQVSTVN